MSDLTPEDVKEILRLVEDSRFDEFELETPRFSVRFRRGESLPADSEAVDAAADDAAGGLVDVVCPLVGTFYRAPAPGSPPFVEEGTDVEEGTTVGIVEVMKLMNRVAAGVTGTVVEVCRDDGTGVQYGDVLFRVRPHG